jgi:hypothetical protein
VSVSSTARSSTAPTRFRLPAFRPGQLLIIAAILGAIVNVLLRPDAYFNADSHSFEAIARSLLAGQGLVYREAMIPELPLYAFRSPGYSVFLALGLALGGELGVLVLQGALNGMAAVLVGSLAGGWGGALAAWAAFAIRLVWPSGWHHSGQYMSETFFEFVTILTVWLAVRGEAKRGLRAMALTGVLAGIAVLTRPVALGCLGALGLWLLFRRFPRGAVVMAFAALLVWLPWPIRNYVRLHAFVPLLTSGGLAAWNMQAVQEPIVAFTYMRDHADMGEVALDEHFREATREVIRQDPAAYARRIARATADYAGPIFERRSEVWLHRFAMFCVLPLLLLPAWWSRAAVPALVWLAEGALIVGIAVHWRYRYPTEWCVVVLAGLGLAAAAERWGALRTARLASAGLAAAVALSWLLLR